MQSYRTYSIAGKTAAWVPEFAVEDLPFSRTAALVPEFAVKNLPWTKYSDDNIQGLKNNVYNVSGLIEEVKKNKHVFI